MEIPKQLIDHFPDIEKKYVYKLQVQLIKAYDLGRKAGAVTGFGLGVAAMTRKAGLILDERKGDDDK